MRARVLTTLGLTLILGLTAACSKDGGSADQAASGSTTTPTTAAPADPPAAGDSVSVASADSPLGQILVGTDGMTLYGFKNDADGQSNCSGTCAEAWPPLTVDANWEVGPGLDNGVFNTVEREDGSQQLVAGQWPLYYYSGDTAPGDMTGQGSGGVWFVVNVDATLNESPAPPGGGSGGGGGEQAAAATVQVAETSLGEVLVDGEGMTLYAFTQDGDGVPTCSGDCASTWPALLVEGEPTIADPLDPATFSTVDGAEGGTQLKAGAWPLYNFSGDSAPGDVNGQGSGGVWYAVAPDGTLVEAG
jgi:predicted lipoprotein with Yx(FWY)xxD motif